MSLRWLAYAGVILWMLMMTLSRNLRKRDHPQLIRRALQRRNSPSSAISS